MMKIPSDIFRAGALRRHANQILALGFLTASMSHAAVLYTDLGPGNTYVYNCTCGWGIGYNGGAGSAVGWVAAPFTPTSDAGLWRVMVAMTWFDGPNNIEFELVNDDNGAPGADVLESWTMTDLSPWQGYNDPNLLASMGPEQTLTSVPGVMLSAGTQYWILAQPDANGDNYFVWMPTGLALEAYTPDSPAVQCALGCGSNSDQSAPALQVESAPEPGALGMLTGALLLSGAIRIRRRGKRRERRLASASPRFRVKKDPTIGQSFPA